MKPYEYARNYQLEGSYWWFVGVRAMVKNLLEVGGGPRRLGKVLDVGCGTGALLDQLAPDADEIWGVDIAPEAIEFCKLRGHKNLAIGDACDLSFPDESFDVITAIGVIEHIDDDERFLEKMRMLLKPGGALILLTSSFPFLWSMHDVANRHKRRYYLGSLKRNIERHGFRTCRLSHFNLILFPAIAASLWIHRLLYGTESERPERILPTVPAWINAMLTRILLFEAWLIRFVRLPWGVSMIGLFYKNHDAD